MFLYSDTIIQFSAPKSHHINKNEDKILNEREIIVLSGELTVTVKGIKIKGIVYPLFLQYIWKW